MAGTIKEKVGIIRSPVDTDLKMTMFSCSTACTPYDSYRLASMNIVTIIDQIFPVVGIKGLHTIIMTDDYGITISEEGF